MFIVVLLCLPLHVHGCKLRGRVRIPFIHPTMSSEWYVVSTKLTQEAAPEAGHVASQVSQDAAASQVSQETVALQVLQETAASQVSQDAAASQMSQETVASQVSQEAAASQVSQEAPVSQVSPETPQSQVSPETPARRVAAPQGAQEQSPMAAAAAETAGMSAPAASAAAAAAADKGAAAGLGADDWGEPAAPVGSSVEAETAEPRVPEAPYEEKESQGSQGAQLSTIFHASYDVLEWTVDDLHKEVMKGPTQMKVSQVLRGSNLVEDLTWLVAGVDPRTMTWADCQTFNVDFSVASSLVH